METSDKIRRALREMPRAEWIALGADCKVGRSTIEKIAYGVTSNPSYNTMTKLADALKRRETLGGA